MKIIVEIDDSSISNNIISKVYQEVDKQINDILSKTNFEKVINNRIEHHVDRSQQLTERTLRNYVQQKIARSLADTMFKKD